MQSKKDIYELEISECTKFVTELPAIEGAALSAPAFFIGHIPYFNYLYVVQNSIGDCYHEKSKELSVEAGELIITLSQFASFYNYNINTLNKMLTNELDKAAKPKSVATYKSAKFYTINELEKFFRFGYLSSLDTISIADYCSKYELSYVYTTTKLKAVKEALGLKQAGVLNSVPLYIESDLTVALNEYAKIQQKIAADRFSVALEKMSSLSTIEHTKTCSGYMTLTAFAKTYYDSTTRKAYLANYNKFKAYVSANDFEPDLYSLDGDALFHTSSLELIAKNVSMLSFKSYAKRMRLKFTDSELKELFNLNSVL